MKIVSAIASSQGVQHRVDSRRWNQIIICPRMLRCSEMEMIETGEITGQSHGALLFTGADSGSQWIISFTTCLRWLRD